MRPRDDDRLTARHFAVALVLLLVGLAGCKQQCFLTERDFRDAHLMPRAVEEDRNFGADPLTGPIAAPPDVTKPDRPARFLTLQEAIAISLENGNASSRGGGIGLGQVDDTLAIFQGGSTVSQSDSVRVLALAPAIAAANIEASLARFDAIWASSMNWSKTDQLQQGLTSFQNGDRANFNTTIGKFLPGGGFVHTSFDTSYNLLDNPPQGGAFGVVNPLYTSRLIIGFEQPLLQGFGTQINQLLSRNNFLTGQTLPSGVAGVLNQTRNLVQQQQTSFVNQGIVDGILITRLRFDMSRAEFERQINGLVLNVEVAYWNLYQAYGELYTFEEVLRLAHRAWRFGYEKVKIGTADASSLALVRGQYEEFRGERLKALGKVLEAERNLRGLMGLRVEDGERLVPITPPTLARYFPDWDICLQDALRLRPELLLARDSLKVAQFNLDIQKNFLKPDLRLTAQYIPTGFGNTLDGRGVFIDGTGAVRPENALQSLRNTSFEDWSIGLTLVVPIGYRQEHAAIRAGRLALAQSFWALQDQERRAERILAQQYQKLSEWHARIQTTREERKAYAESVESIFKKAAGGAAAEPLALLESQRRLALAQQKEYQAIAEYNSTLSRLEWSRGNILRYNNVLIAEGGLPICAEVRAVEHERERSKAFHLRDKPPLTHPGPLAFDVGDLPESLPLPDAAADDAEPAPPPRLHKIGEGAKGADAAPPGPDAPPALLGFKAHKPEEKKDTGWTLPTPEKGKAGTPAEPRKDTPTPKVDTGIPVPDFTPVLPPSLIVLPKPEEKPAPGGSGKTTERPPGLPSAAPITLPPVAPTPKVETPIAPSGKSGPLVPRAEDAAGKTPPSPGAIGSRSEPTTLPPDMKPSTLPPVSLPPVAPPPRAEPPAKVETPKKTEMPARKAEASPVLPASLPVAPPLDISLEGGPVPPLPVRAEPILPPPPPALNVPLDGGPVPPLPPRTETPSVPSAPPPPAALPSVPSTPLVMPDPVLGTVTLPSATPPR